MIERHLREILWEQFFRMHVFTNYYKYYPMVYWQDTRGFIPMMNLVRISEVLFFDE